MSRRFRRDRPLVGVEATDERLIVVVVRRGPWRVVRAGFADLPPGAFAHGSIREVELVGGVLSKLRREMKLPTNAAATLTLSALGAEVGAATGFMSWNSDDLLSPAHAAAAAVTAAQETMRMGGFSDATVEPGQVTLARAARLGLDGPPPWFGRYGVAGSIITIAATEDSLDCSVAATSAEPLRLEIGFDLADMSPIAGLGEFAISRLFGRAADLAMVTAAAARQPSDSFTGGWVPADIRHGRPSGWTLHEVALKSHRRTPAVVPKGSNS